MASFSHAARTHASGFGLRARDAKGGRGPPGRRFYHEQAAGHPPGAICKPQDAAEGRAARTSREVPVPGGAGLRGGRGR